MPTMGWNFWNMVATVGAFTIALSVLVFILNVAVSRKRKDIAGEDPWDGRTLEWMTSSPPPEYNFAEIPLVKDRDDLWRRKYVTTPEGVPAPVVAGGADDHGHGDGDHGHIHMPSPSYFPIVAAAGLPLLGYGAVYENFLLLIAGGLIAMFGLFGWAFEPGTEE